MSQINRRELHPIQSFDEVPQFASEEEEADFWATHSFGEAILDQMQPVPFDDEELPPPRPRKRSVLQSLGRGPWIDVNPSHAIGYPNQPALQLINGATWVQHVRHERRQARRTIRHGARRAS